MSDNIQQMYRKAHAAFEQIEFWPQDRIDEVCAAVGWELQKEETAKELAHLAVSESGIGVYEDKVHKIQNKTRGMMRDMGVKTRIEVIPNGVNLQRYSPERNPDEAAGIRERLGIPGDAPLVATVGAVMPRKGSDLLLEAWRRLIETLPDAHLLFVGPRKDLEHPDLGGFSMRLERLAQDSGRPGQVHFVGMADNVEAYLHAADVFVLPSRREGTPNSVLEAMACGVPVVVTPFLGLSQDLGRQGEHYLLADFSPEALAHTIGELLQDPEQRRQLAGSALQWIRQTMDLETSLDRYAALYREIAGK